MNNAFYDKNIESLKKKFPSEYKIYFEKKVIQTNKYAFYSVHNNIKVPVNITDKKSFYDLNDPLKAIQSALCSPDYVKPFYFFYGLAAGYHIQVIRDLAPHSYIFVFENDLELFDAVINNVDISDILSDPSLFFFLNSSSDDILERLEKSFGGILVFDEALFLDVTGDNSYTEINAVLKGEKKILDKDITFPEQTLKNIATLKLFGNDWLKNIVENTYNYLNSQSLEILNNLFPGCKTIIVAAGPSLDKDIQNLSVAKNKFLIICVDTALKKLLKYGIQPDIIVSIDIGAHNLRYLNEVSENSALVCDIAMPDKITSLYKDKTIYTHYGHSIPRFLDLYRKKEGKTVGTGTVFSVAFDIAYRIGSSEIYFMGADFSYSNFKEHCETSGNKNTFSSLESISKFLTNETIFFSHCQSEGDIIIDGYLTTKKFLNWKTWLEVQIMRIKNSDEIKFYNMTSTGLTIKGSKKINSSQIKEYIRGMKEKFFLHEILMIINSSSISPDIEGMRKELKSAHSDAKTATDKIRKYLQRLEKNADGRNFEHFYSAVFKEFQNLYRNSRLSDILRWQLFLEDIEFRKLKFNDKFTNLSVLVKLEESYIARMEIIEKIFSQHFSLEI